MPAVSTYETDLAVLGREDFRLIVAFIVFGSANVVVNTIASKRSFAT
jgi:hypothetical protein